MKALELDDRLAEAHASLGYIKSYHDCDWNGAERAFRRAIELNPGYAYAHAWYAHCLSVMGRLAEALTEIERARELDPLSLAINTDLGLFFMYAGQNDRAIEQLRKTLDMDPNFTKAYLFLGQAYGQKGMHKEAVAAAQKGLAVSERAPFALGPVG